MGDAIVGRWYLASIAALLAVLVALVVAVSSVGRVGDAGARRGSAGDGAARTPPATDTGGPGDAAIVGRLDLDAPAEARAGERILVEVRGPAPGEDVHLLVVGSLGSSTFSALAPDDGVLGFSLAPALTRSAGALRLIARTDLAIGTATVGLHPGPIVDPVDPVIGPRSIVADGAEHTMVVTIPTDSLGNGAADGVPVDVVARRPSGDVTRARVGVELMVAWELVLSQTVAGRTDVRTGSGDATGTVTPLIEVAGPPVALELEVMGPIPAADGQSLVPLRTSVLVDRFGNVVPDGTLVTLDWTGPVGRSRTSSSTLGGLARFTIEAPDRPGSFEIVAHCEGTTTETPLVITYGELDTAVAFSAHRSGTDVVVTVGPVLDPIGGFLPDGTIVTVTAATTSGTSASRQGALVDGAVSVLVEDDRLVGELVVAVEVLGLRRATRLP